MTRRHYIQPLPQDLVRLAAERACRLFGGAGCETFNAAGFSKSLCRIAGIAGPLDGSLVRAILWGRVDVVPLAPGDAHYRLRHYTPAPPEVSA